MHLNLCYSASFKQENTLEPIQDGTVRQYVTWIVKINLDDNETLVLKARLFSCGESCDNIQ